MVQQLFSEMEKLKTEIRRLRGRMDSFSAGNQIIPAGIPGTAQVPAPLDGAIIRGNATPAWERLAASVPGASVRNILGLDNGDLRPSWKAGLDATNPADVTIEGPATPGTSLVMSHRDHRHDISTTEVDTSLRLAPDGAGGVEWGTGGGGRFYIPFGSEAIEGQATTP